MNRAASRCLARFTAAFSRRDAQPASFPRLRNRLTSSTNVRGQRSRQRSRRRSNSLDSLAVTGRGNFQFSGRMETVAGRYGDDKSLEVGGSAAGSLGGSLKDNPAARKRAGISISRADPRRASRVRSRVIVKRLFFHMTPIAAGWLHESPLNPSIFPHRFVRAPSKPRRPCQL